MKVERADLLRELKLACVVTEGKSPVPMCVPARKLYARCKAIEGTFPAFEKIVERVGAHRVVLNRAQTATAIQRVRLLSSRTHRTVEVALSSGELLLRSGLPDEGDARERLTVPYTGKAVRHGFNADYLIDFLSAVAPAETVEADFGSVEEDPGGFSAGADYRYVVMPVRL